jgi:hypothetical protein
VRAKEAIGGFAAGTDTELGILLGKTVYISGPKGFAAPSKMPTSQKVGILLGHLAQKSGHLAPESGHLAAQ